MTDRTKLKRDLNRLEARVDSEEQKLEDLMQEPFADVEPEGKLHLEKKMRDNKGIVETARKDWEQASASYLDNTADGNKRAAEVIEQVNEALLPILK